MLPKPSTSAAVRSHVTPEAFRVAPHLIGLPLGSPWRRLVAVLTDIVIVAIIAGLAGTLFSAPNVELIDRRAELGPEIEEVGDAGANADAGADEAADAGRLSSEEEILREIAAAVEDPARAAQLAESFERQADTPRGLSAWLQGVLQDLGLGLGWGAAYFTILTVRWNGRTVGKRLLGVRCVRLNGEPWTYWEAFSRYGGYAAGFATGLLGFAQVFWDSNRQGIHDKIAFTAVVRDVRPRAGAAAEEPSDAGPR